MASLKVGDVVRFSKNQETTKNLGIILEIKEIKLDEKIYAELDGDHIDQMLEFLAVDSLKDIEDLRSVNVLWDSGKISSIYANQLEKIYS